MAKKYTHRTQCIICSKVRARFNPAYEVMLDSPWRPFCMDHRGCNVKCKQRSTCKHETFREMFARLNRIARYG